MFAKIFRKIHDSTVARDWETRLVFMDLLLLADREGVVNMPPDAIARRTNVPQEVVDRAIDKLSSPDPSSNTQEYEGRRIILLDDAKKWGWQIVNYTFYRNVKSEDELREEIRHRVSRHRQNRDAEPVNVTIPDALNVPVFLEAWGKWLTYRKRLRKPKDWNSFFQEQLDWLAKFDVEQAAEIVRKSMRNGWTGLFEEKNVKPLNGPVNRQDWREAL